MRRNLFSDFDEESGAGYWVSVLRSVVPILLVGGAAMYVLVGASRRTLGRYENAPVDEGIRLQGAVRENGGGSLLSGLDDVQVGDELMPTAAASPTPPGRRRYGHTTLLQDGHRFLPYPSPTPTDELRVFPQAGEGLATPTVRAPTPTSSVGGGGVSVGPGPGSYPAGPSPTAVPARSTPTPTPTPWPTRVSDHYGATATPEPSPTVWMWLYYRCYVPTVFGG